MNFPFFASPKNALWQFKFGWIWPSSCEEEHDTVKSLLADGHTDERTDQRSLLDISHKLSKIPSIAVFIIWNKRWSALIFSFSLNRPVGQGTCQWESNPHYYFSHWKSNLRVVFAYAVAMSSNVKRISWMPWVQSILWIVIIKCKVTIL